MAEDIKLTREEQIEAYGAEHKRRMENVEEFKRQELILKLNLAVMDQEKSKQIESTLDSLPDISAKGMVDKILQIPMEKRTQLNENIIKLGLAVENETRRANEAHRSQALLEQQIRDEQTDAHTKETFSIFQEWLDAFKACRSIFYDKLYPVIQQGYNLSPDFYKRAEKLGLDKSMMVSIESHFRHGEKVSMDEAIERILNLSDAYTPGHFLLPKDEEGGSWPKDASGQFYSQL